MLKSPEMQKILNLADGSTIAGESFGADSAAAGEVVFATGMVGYPESFTDPSFAGQILVLTYPLVGNYGVPPKFAKNSVEQNFESEKLQIAGLVVSEYSEKYSHHAAVESLSEWLKRENIPAITGVDTRALTQKLRESGTILGEIGQQTADSRQQTVRKFYDPNKEHLVARVSPTEPRFFLGGKRRSRFSTAG